MIFYVSPKLTKCFDYCYKFKIYCLICGNYKVLLKSKMSKINMSKLRLKYIAMIICGIIFFVSCNKEPGEGGAGKISGKLFGYDVNNAGIVTDSGYAGGYRVYISYGTEGIANNDVRTSYNGQYEFAGLKKGTYTVFAYSQCDTCLFNQSSVKQTVTLSSNKDEVIVPDLVIYD